MTGDIGKSDSAVENTRTKLISAALKTFSASGFEGVSIRQVERVAGVERGLVAYHFRSKSILWRSAVDFAFEPYFTELSALSDALRDVSRRERARAIVMAYTRFNAMHPEVFRLLVIEGSIVSDRSEFLAEKLRRMVELFRSSMGESDPLEIDETVMNLQVIGAAGFPFAAPLYSSSVYQLTALDTEFVHRYAEAVADMLLNSMDKVIAQQRSRVGSG